MYAINLLIRSPCSERLCLRAKDNKSFYFLEDVLQGLIRALRRAQVGMIIVAQLLG